MLIILNIGAWTPTHFSIDAMLPARDPRHHPEDGHSNMREPSQALSISPPSNVLLLVRRAHHVKGAMMRKVPGEAPYK